MTDRKCVSYLRVSSVKQGDSQLGIEAQRAAVTAYISREHWTLIDEFTEIETAKGANALERRPQLRAAFDLCRKRKAILVIARLDRLARNVHFVSGLIESGAEFLAVDMPQANKTMLQIHSVMAEWERDAISARTREALAAAKIRGIQLGVTGRRNLPLMLERRRAQADSFAESVRALLEGLRTHGLSQRAIVKKLNALGVKSPRGGEWHLKPLQRVLARLAAK
jgi:DNA invertase Pin-like site-specific DNA recombinase